MGREKETLGKRDRHTHRFKKGKTEEMKNSAFRGAMKVNSEECQSEALFRERYDTTASLCQPLSHNGSL